MGKKVEKTAKKKTSPKKSLTKAPRTTTISKAAAEKKQPKKTAAKDKKSVAKQRKSTLSAAELAQFREMLMKKRAELLGDVDSIESEALKKSRLSDAGDLSSMPIHMADLGTDNFEQEFALELMDSERKMLNKINAALNRIDAGVYGICEGTGKPITKARLKANPWARYCVKYATMVEQGLVREGEKVYGQDEYDTEDLEVSDDIEGHDEDKTDHDESYEVDHEELKDEED